MIIVRFTSGLGNQMYQYNLYRYLEERYEGTKVRADLTWFYANNDHHGFELRRIFEGVKGSQFSLKEASKSEIYSCSGQIPVFLKGPLAKSVRFLLGPVNRKLKEAGKPRKNGITLDQLERPIKFEEIDNLDTTRNYYICGFFIEEHYVKGRLDKLKKEFVFPGLCGEDEVNADDANVDAAKSDAAKSDETKVDATKSDAAKTDAEKADAAKPGIIKENTGAAKDANVRMLARIRESNSVSIHVRRGDYLSSTYSSQFIALGREYYEGAVKYIRGKITDPEFFIFSDDAQYIREAFNWLDNKEIVDINKGNDSYKDMMLMSNCKSNIIANSTFSQWAALLNDNPGRIVVYPAKYLSYEDSEVKSLKGWVRM